MIDALAIQNPIKNMWVVFLGIAGAILAFLAIGLQRLLCPCFSWGRRKADGLKDDLQWNYFIRLIIENYLDILITNALNLYRLKFDHWFESVVSVMSITLTTVFVGLFVLSMVYLCLRFRTVHKE